MNAFFIITSPFVNQSKLCLLLQERYYCDGSGAEVGGGALVGADCELVSLGLSQPHASFTQLTHVPPPDLHAVS
ncbi:hypothetical protein A3B02_00640 [Candidatus Roizmanbacteria bacterium RIFCSPLOWO2_01_FULL_42_14]|uniref:Uncharacterized protein n=1 Tax=Candidatus Roizmanbacteria bacterium RIFCSPLOWO2_01_FULL_42_14 TaxID=1802068 RepID=A0A1F7J7N8_9BACT|nr:MAG: hypothetical protein A3B02_00640 [Candidatus Roizmanbacteria bacterium RIFCSPLOWO2_01_FULL_42_14]